MSWDVMIMNAEGTPADISAAPADWMPAPMGNADSVRKQISKAVPGVNWSDPTWGLYDGRGFSIEFSVESAAMVEAFTLHLHGGGDPLPTIVALCRQNKWVAFDYSDGQLINLESPSRESWVAFQKYRDRVLNQS